MSSERQSLNYFYQHKDFPGYQPEPAAHYILESDENAQHATRVTEGFQLEEQYEEAEVFTDLINA